ncbi:PBECR3 domain-containing polyvalent protein [Sedimentibacter sp. MB31-C6]|uniref:PBECR3 domain-containing polyvalent protein n=1 Tax=Sedimentibacter sp. MB31-C6 TaxID=3109366 RepID=UPI002DDD94BA|nr:hypothetical protein [Sedimentibacter sp. MB36-C1]WSI03589.1 hypothetical protein U8307_11080 [Sedimentibacter sp. MB36-C1]
MIKRKHFKCLKYIDIISDILEEPDYIGISPNEVNSIEIIKRYDDIILLGIKLDMEENYFYISTIYDIQKSKISRRLYSGRIVEFNH